MDLSKVKTQSAYDYLSRNTQTQTGLPLPEIQPSMPLKQHEKDIPAIPKLEEIKEVANRNDFVLDRYVFTIFKLSDGVLYTRVRDLETGEIKYFPSLKDININAFKACEDKIIGVES